VRLYHLLRGPSIKKNICVREYVTQMHALSHDLKVLWKEDEKIIFGLNKNKQFPQLITPV
jgi:hypothetical protein